MNNANMLKMFMNSGKTPKEIAIQMLGNYNNPVINNLVQMAEKGDYQGVESFARNMFREQGRDFDKELQDMQNFINNFKK